MGAWLRHWLALPDAGSTALDDAATTNARARLVRQKPFLRKLYEEWYTMLAQATRYAPHGPRVELGSGPGFFKEVVPGLITSEVQRAGHIDLVLDAAELPFAGRSVSVLYLVDVFHHLQDPGRFLGECERVLKPGGMVAMIEPWNTPWARWVWTHLHHEPFDPHAGWALPGRAPLSEANGAAPWIVFIRDRGQLEAAHKELTVESARPFMPLAYLLSGGVSMRALLPGWAYGPWRWGEGAISCLNPWIGMFACITLHRRKEEA